MPNAAAHILIPMILMSLIRKYRLKDKMSITNRHILFCGIGGILPDIDVLAGLIMSLVNGSSPMMYHRMATHSIIIPVLLSVVVFALYTQKKKELGKIFLMVTIGYSIHLMLDFALIGKVMLFYPLSATKFGLNIIQGNEIGKTLMMGLDTLLLLVWFIHMHIKDKIKDYV